jgi:hypothetical protein
MIEGKTCKISSEYGFQAYREGIIKVKESELTAFNMLMELLISFNGIFDEIARFDANTDRPDNHYPFL